MCKAAWSRYLNKEGFTFARAKVGKFDAFPRDEYILRFDVSMENSLAMNILDGFEELIHVGFDLVMV